MAPPPPAGDTRVSKALGSLLAAQHEDSAGPGLVRATSMGLPHPQAESRLLHRASVITTVTGEPSLGLRWQRGASFGFFPPVPATAGRAKLRVGLGRTHQTLPQQDTELVASSQEAWGPLANVSL